ncbi:MAG TPA: 2-oxoacid:acceptor oxidoreductase family protein, partial [Methanomicrobiales archaeon]|nr:2-oxoacid:acceptor oxidoreductase family protein [Methanomicrobiales archaeon]
VFYGMQEGGIAIINTEKGADSIKVPKGVRLVAVDATQIALDVLGVPITNTSLMGAFAAATGMIRFQALADALKHRFGKDLGEKNVQAARVAYDQVGGSS